MDDPAPAGLSTDNAEIMKMLSAGVRLDRTVVWLCLNMELN